MICGETVAKKLRAVESQPKEITTEGHGNTQKKALKTTADFHRFFEIKADGSGQ